jgi:hypothetical protein
MNAPWIVVASIIAVAALYVLLPIVADTFLRFRGKKLLRCPVTGERAVVDVDARRAALTSAFGRMLLKIRGCSLWPGREGCAQDCVHLPEIGERR